MQYFTIALSRAGGESWLVADIGRTENGRKVVNLSPMKKAVDLVKTFLHLDYLIKFQEQALTAILEERDVFTAQPTGSGKSAVYLHLRPL